MSAIVNISIPNPCSKKWADLEAKSDGGFCSSCHKTVVDFTKMSDDDILRYLKNRSAHTCGRFKPDQLKVYHPWQSPTINPGLTLLKAGLISLFVLLTTRQSVAVSYTRLLMIENTGTQKADSISTMSSIAGHIVSGFIRDDYDGTAVPGTNVVLKGSEIGTTTNAEGWFEFPKALEEGDVLVFSFIGYETKEYVVPKHASDRIEIRLSMDISVMGDIAVNEVYTEKSGMRRWWESFKDRF